MSRFDELLGALRGRGDLAEWLARGRQATRVTATRDAAGALTRAAAIGEVAATVHVDAATGRGSATVQVAGDRAPGPLIDAAVARAGAALGPAWRSPPPGAPARVDVFDARLADPERAAADALAALAAAIERAGAATVTASAEVEIADHAVTTSRGLAVRWSETAIAVRATIAVDGLAATLAARGRAAAQLGVAARVDAAVARARAAATARPTPPGRAAVVLPAELLGGDAAPVLGALAALGDAALHRQGLARAPLGRAVVDGADGAAQPLTVRSDGTRALGPESAPLGPHGEPVRRFTLIADGVLVGLALDQREAALRGVPPNGGARNLTLGGGASSADELRGDGVLELLELTHADVEPLTGHGALGIGLAWLHGAAGTPPRAVRGGEVQGDLVAALLRSRRTRDQVIDGAYAGPALVWLPDLAIL